MDERGGLPPACEKGATVNARAFYNEIDTFAAAWLEQLIAAGAICPGVVDRRDIRDIRPSDLDGFNQCHFFAGIGGWSYALRLAGIPDSAEVWTGSCPCQPFSAAGRGLGFADERHLWPAFFHLIDKCRPAKLFGEQVASKPGLAWLDLVRSDLEGAGYAVGAADLCAAGVGAPHIRQRLWFVADALEARSGFAFASEESAERDGLGAALLGGGLGIWDRDGKPCRFADGKTRLSQPGVDLMVDGLSACVGVVGGAGNAIVPQVAAEFVRACL